MVNRREVGCTYIGDLVGNVYVLPFADFDDVDRAFRQYKTTTARIDVLKFELSSVLAAEERAALRAELTEGLAMQAANQFWEAETLFGSRLVVDLDRITHVHQASAESIAVAMEEERANTAADAIQQ